MLFSVTVVHSLPFVDYFYHPALFGRQALSDHQYSPVQSDGALSAKDLVVCDYDAYLVAFNQFLTDANLDANQNYTNDAQKLKDAINGQLTSTSANANTLFRLCRYVIIYGEASIGS